MSVDNARKGHVTPGVYSTETEITYSNKSMGITTLGVAGETLKGPAFQPIFIDNWNNFKKYFGGTSTEHFKGSGYPKYELPYIAKEYLTESNQLYVTKVLGFSGYNAGPAWVIKANGTGKGDGMIVAVIRSRGEFKRTVGIAQDSTDEVTSGKIEEGFAYVVRGQANSTVTYDGKTYAKDEKFVGVEGVTTFTFTNAAKVYGDCGTQYKFDKLFYFVDPSYNDDSFLSIEPSYTEAVNFSCNNVNKQYKNTQNEAIPSSSNDYGTFTLKGKTIYGEEFNYMVSFNPNRKDYIYNVIGQTPDDNNAPIFIEELYDVALEQLVLNNINGAKDTITGIFYDEAYAGGQTIKTKGLEFFDYTIIDPEYKSVESVLVLENQILSKRYEGNRYLFVYSDSVETDYIEETINVDGTSKLVYKVTADTDDGKIFVVKRDKDASGKVTYNYHYVITKVDASTTTQEQLKEKEFVFVTDEQLYYTNKGGSIGVVRVFGDMNDYKEMYRYASTPWVVSEIKGNSAVNDVVRLFRFHTISDGDTANKMVKISIRNIDPENLTFDVVVRDFNDNDASIAILESFAKCNLNPNSANYIVQKIGDINNEYETKSQYITVEMADNNETGMYSIPCGFLGYPVRNLNGLQAPYLKYNTDWDEEIKTKRQFFGVSNLVGIDTDILTYKGRSAYSDGVFTNGFHLDSRISDAKTTVDGINPIDDGGDYLYTWQTVGIDNRVNDGEAPRITNGEDIIDTIYEDKEMRKFTLVPFGGFDGWDIYRKSRSNTDDFTVLKYKGELNVSTGVGEHFSYIKDGDLYGLNTKALTSDYYAYLSAYRTFENTAETDINLLATPGIDYVNNLLLVNEVIDMIEEDRQDCLYVVTTPDKPYGATDGLKSIYTAEEAAYNMEISEIDSNYACTYYPWVRVQDEDSKKTLFLPVTKDICKTIALIDNTSYSWFPPAGDGFKIDCISTRYNLKLDECDELYENRINPIRTYAQDGVYAWGIKNMQLGDGLLTRIGVRRMLIRIKKLVEKSVKSLIFQPNDATAKKKFLSIVNPILEDVRSNRGISAYEVEVDDSVEARERRELPCKIWIKPINMLEYITLDYIVTPEGANWS